MVQKTVILVLYCCFTLISKSSAQISDIGRIIIGAYGNDTSFTNKTEYVFNMNAAGASLSLPFYALAYNRTDGKLVPIQDNITVTCEDTLGGQGGYTKLSFSSTVLFASSGQPRGTVTFSVVTAGRGAAIKCYGVSLGLTCPAVTTGSITTRQPQFCKESSLSDPVTVTVTPAPVVSFCDQQKIVLRGTVTDSFTVTLSEAVSVGTTVTVNCSQISPNNLCERLQVDCCQSNSMSLMFSPVNVTAGVTTVNILYNVTNEGSCIGVQCMAVSTQVNGDGYLQYSQTTSQDWSSEALFVQDKAEIHMVPQFVKVYDTSFQTFLYLDKYRNMDVTFQCQASVVGSAAEALQRLQMPDCNFVTATTAASTLTTSPVTTTTTTTTVPTATLGNDTTAAVTTTTTTTSPPDPSSPWLTVNNSFTLPTGKLYQVVKTQRQYLVISPVLEIVVTTCCAISNSSKYSGLATSAVAVADLQPLVCANCSGDVRDASLSSERVVINPAYQEVAPCPCDMTFRACDINCCCDEECTASERETFSVCVPGLAGGQLGEPPLHRCQSDQFPKADWFPVMCVQFESNALLGYFYSDTQKLTSLTDINNLVAQETDLFTYRETEDRYTDLDQVSGYKDGSSILTVMGEGSSLLFGTLSLPQLSSSGQCVDTAPVRFLRNSQAACSRKLTEALCGNFSAFSARAYVQGSNVFNPACPRSFRISTSGQPGSYVKVDVIYYCTSNYSTYVKSSQTFSSSLQEDTEYTFTSGLDNVTCTDPCQECYPYNSGRLEATSNPLPAVCSFDTGFDLPPEPTFNSSTSICQHAVLEVRYDLRWSGQTVVGLTAHVVLGFDVPSSSIQDVTQRFKVTFVHNYTGSSNQSDNFENLTTQYYRSGRPGYDPGQPLQTGCSKINSTTGLFEEIDTAPEKQMAVFSPGIDGLCDNAKRRTLTFGDNMLSSCVLRLAINTISNCASLKKLILNHLNVLMPASVVSRFGYSSSSNQDMWITVLKQDPYGQSVTNASTTTTTTTSPWNTTVASNPTEESVQNVEVFLLSDRRGLCYNVTTGIHLEILYAETGRNKGYPLLEVVGAMISYTLGNWSMSCSGADSASCLNDSTRTQTFLLSSSVQFTRVSATTPVKPILFYTIHKKETCDSDTCYRFFEDFDTSICHYDTCWYELFYPLTAAYLGYEGQSYTRAFSLLIVLFLIGYFAVSKPWK